MDKKPKVGTNNSANFFAGVFVGKNEKSCKKCCKVATLQLFDVGTFFFIVFNSKR